MYDRDMLLRGMGPRRVGADGMIEIKCRICEKPICREMYRGFSTATCAVCQGEMERGKRPEDILAAALQQEDRERAGVLDDLGPGGFKAHGFGVRMKEIVQKVKMAAQKRKRPPLFDVRDKIE